MKPENEYLKLIRERGPAAVIDKLSLYLSERRKERIEEALKKRMNTVHVAVENPADIYNAIATVRTSEALGVSNIHIIGGGIKKMRGRSVAQGTDRWTHLHRHQSLQEYVSLMQEKKMTIAGASLEGKILLEELPENKPLCLLFGNEMSGLSEEAISACGIAYRIPMYGFVESFNISVSCAISLYSFLNRRRAFLHSEGDLSGEELAQERAYYFLRAFGLEKAKKLF